MKVGIYLRVLGPSAREASRNQARQLTKLAHRQNWTVVKIYQEPLSGQSKKQVEHCQMLADAEKGRFQVLLFWSLNQLCRQGAISTLRVLYRLSSCGVAFRSFSEPDFDTSGPHSDLVLSILTGLWRQQSIYESDQTKIGLQRQKRTKQPGPNGRFGPGRPPVSIDLELAKSMRTKGESYRAIGQALGVSPSTIYRLLERKQASA
jgi:DNA invertase Pin-like site-specific DNA recombinase